MNGMVAPQLPSTSPLSLLFNASLSLSHHPFSTYILSDSPLSTLNPSMKLTFLAFLLLSLTIALATRPEPAPQDDGGMGGFGIPGGGGFGIPGFPIIGGGYGSGSGGPNGGHSKGGVIRPTVVCKEKGPCYLKKLRCPAKCFSSYGRSGKGYGYGGGGGGCTMDCKKKCIAYC